MNSYVLYYNIEKSGFNAVSAYISSCLIFSRITVKLQIS